MTCLTPLLLHCATPPLAFPKRVACAASRLHVQPTVLFPLFRHDDNIHRVPVTLLTITKVSPMHVLIPGASLRDRAALPSPLRGLGPSGGHPSPLRSLRSLRAPLGSAVRTAHRRLPRRRRSALLPLRGSSAFMSSSRRRCAPCSSTPSPRLAEPRPLSRRRGSPAVPPPGPFPPTFGTLDWVFSTPFGGSALTPEPSRRSITTAPGGCSTRSMLTSSHGSPVHCPQQAYFELQVPMDALPSTGSKSSTTASRPCKPTSTPSSSATPPSGRASTAA